MHGSIDSVLPPTTGVDPKFSLLFLDLGQKIDLDCSPCPHPLPLETWVNLTTPTNPTPRHLVHMHGPMAIS